LKGSQFQDSLGKKKKKSLQDPIYRKKLGRVVCSCHSRYRGKLKIGELRFRLAWA
jgi:hypothetical protein